MSDLVSVIIPTFNRSQFLLRAIHSVLNQTYKNIELLVVDDGSTDETHKLLTPLIENKSLHYIKKNNGGVSSARNAGVFSAKGKWIAFLDSDDEWLTEKLEEQLSFLKYNSHLSIVYTDEIWMRNGVRVNQKNGHRKSGGDIFLKCIQQCLIAPSSVLINKKLFVDMQGFNEEFVVCEDYDLWLKISSLHEIGFIAKPLIIKYGGHDDQLSMKFFAMDSWRLKSMYFILLNRKLETEKKALLIKLMQQKGAILIQGYLKHGNPVAASEIELLLSKISEVVV